RGLLYSSLQADGHGWELLYCQPGSKHPIDKVMVDGRQQYLKLRGREVFKFAVGKFTEMVEDAVRKTGISKDQIKLVIPHQSNLRIIEASMQKIGLPLDRAVVNIDRYGNTSAASIPIALDEAVRGGKLVKGDVAVFIAIGAGLTWANAVVRM
ncbi:MAG: fabH, partial [Phycisphaerales bacterium]|nr:fabH [Phycisphaerales bacterium]